MGRQYSIVEYFGRDLGHHCGYCDGDDTNVSHGMWAHTLAVGDYQGLIDRGWRRSGKYCYKPVMNVTCCPQYSIRLDVTKYKATKSQRKVARRFRNYIINGRGEHDARTSQSTEEYEPETSSSGKGTTDLARMELAQGKCAVSSAEGLLDGSKAVNEKGAGKDDEGKDGNGSTTKRKKNEDANATWGRCDKKPGKANLAKTVKAGTGADLTKPKPKKAKERRREKAAAKGKVVGARQQPAIDGEKTIADLLFEPFPEGTKHKFEIVTLPSHTDDQRFAAVFDEEYKLYVRYQVNIHKDPINKVTKSQFKRFLCNASLFSNGGEGSDDGDVRGAFHQQYRIDGRLVMVGVVDVLSKCVSSKYLFYDPDFAHLSPGTLSSLFEIAYIQKLRLSEPDLAYYYMGYYIHTCPKMRYKARYAPSDLLCPVTFDWVQFDKASPILDAEKFAQLKQTDDEASLPSDSTDGCARTRKPSSELGSHGNMENAMLLFKRTVMPSAVYWQMRQKTPQEKIDEDREIAEYVCLIGDGLAGEMLLYRDDS